MPVKTAFRKSRAKTRELAKAMSRTKPSLREGLKPSLVHMPLKALIKEHEKLIHVLKNGTEKEMKKELKDQTKELLKYKKYK